MPTLRNSLCGSSIAEPARAIRTARALLCVLVPLFFAVSLSVMCTVASAQSFEEHAGSTETRSPQIVAPGFELSSEGTNSPSYSNQTYGNLHHHPELPASSPQTPQWASQENFPPQQIVRGQQSTAGDSLQFNDSIPITPPQPGGGTNLISPSKNGKNNVITTVTSSLVIVISLFLLLAWLSKRTQPKGNAQLPSEVVETLGRSTLSNRQTMHLVKVGNKLILLSVTPTGAETLTEITDDEEVQRIIALCQSGQGSSITNSFRQVLHQMGEEPAPPGFLGTDDEPTTNETNRGVSRMETYHA